LTITPNLSLAKIYSGHFKYRFPAIAGIVVLFILPSDGLAISICWFQMIFEFPCPACGLTRSMSSLLHFEYFKSLMYHPLGMVVLCYLFLLLITNRQDFLKTIVQKKSEKLALLFSFKFIALLFIVFWIYKLFNIS